MYCACMHRTQLLLDDWQYEALRSRAEREGRSLSALVREILGASLTAPSPAAREGIDAIAGIGEDATADGKHHDRYLYADKRPLR